MRVLCVCVENKLGIHVGKKKVEELGKLPEKNKFRARFLWRLRDIIR